MVDEFESFTTVTYDPCTHVCPVHGKTIPCTFNVNDPATIVYGPFCANCIDLRGEWYGRPGKKAKNGIR